MPTPFARLEWYTDRVTNISTIVPQRAHDRAASEAAGLAARAIRSKGTGALARDVSRVQRLGPMHSAIASKLPYAVIEARGGTIRPRNSERLLIHGTRVGSRGRSTRSTVGGPVVASAKQVSHRGKHYDEIAAKAYPELFKKHLKAML